MIKYATIPLLAIILSASHSRAQSISDLLTQLALDTQKLARLKSILKDMYTGYEVINKGYTEIRDIAAGNFHLHSAFLDALLAISPAVQHYSRIAEIADAAYSILTAYKAASARFHNGGHFTPQELNYIDNTYSAVFHQSLLAVDELTRVITAGQLRMPDAERLEAIDRIYTDITGQLSFLHRFNNNTGLQEIQREKNAAGIQTVKSIYGITD